MGLLDDSWQRLTNSGPDTWLALAAWATLAVGVVALLYLSRQVRYNRRSTAEQVRPHVAVFMEPHAADWHVIELVVRNFGKTPAYDVGFSFAEPPTVARYETASDGYADLVPLQLPDELPVLAPDQEWRTVWDSAIDRAELGDAIQSRFTGVVTYYATPQRPPGLFRRKRPQLENNVTLDWHELPPVKRVELMTTHDLAKRERQKLQLLRSLLTYFNYACQETRPDVFRGEIDRINLASREVQDRLRGRGQPPDDSAHTEVTVRLGEAMIKAGKHRN